MDALDWLVIAALVIGSLWVWRRHARLHAARDKAFHDLHARNMADAGRPLPTLEDFRARAHRGRQ